jgi:hypothetical protein
MTVPTMFRRFLGPLIVALFAGVATLATIAPDGNGPGVTCDELYHVAQGKQLVTALRQQGFAFFLPANIQRNFSWQPSGPPVQAPLGYWILGWTHYLFDPAPDDPLVLSIPAARFAPAIAFAILVLIVGVWTSRREGQLAGTVAAAAVTLTPRLFGHAHLAALDMLTALFFVAAVLAVAEAVRGGRFWQFALAGVVWGAAMLVRLHGMLVAPPVVLWMLWRLIYYRQASKNNGGVCSRPPSPPAPLPKGEGSCCCSPWAWSHLWHEFVGPLGVWLAAAATTLFVGWPWLWMAPLTRLQQYLASGTVRQTLHVFYFGQVWADRDVPWHYPWVMFAITVPLGFLVLGLFGVRQLIAAFRVRRSEPRVSDTIQKAAMNRRSPEEPLLAGTIAFVLLVFLWPGVPVYDGVRLFLMVFPLWAIFVGIGARWLSERPSVTAWPSWARNAALVVFIAMQGLGLIVYHPCHLSYYNLLVGGLPGAARLGFEVTYWGDTVREPMLAEAAERSHGGPILFAPNLASFQAPAVMITSPALRTTGTALVGWDSSAPETAAGCRVAIVYHRRADLAGVEWILKHGKVVTEYKKQGVWLATLLELPAPLDARGQ